jgi:hypothetical protein
VNTSSSRDQRRMTSMVVTSVTPDGSEILARDQLGATHSIRGLNRPKGTGLPAVNETWLADQSSGDWRLVSQYDTPPLASVNSPEGLLQALSDMGLVTISSVSAWTPLVLSTGWTALAGTEPPAWIMKNGVVYLRGWLSGPGTNAVMATLPTAIFPGGTKSFAVASVGGYGQISLSLSTSGALSQLLAGSATLSISLDQVVYVLPS